MRLGWLVYGLWFLLLYACVSDHRGSSVEATISISPNYDALSLPQNPNIVWIVAEDLSPVIPPFGDSSVSTPHLERLASEGVRYPNVFSPSGVCAPSRAAIATGMYPTRIGAMHMRTGPWFRFRTTDRAILQYSRTAYEALPPPGTHMHATYMRRAGYYCVNNPKEDYQFRCEMTAWDESGFTAHWKNRKGGQPFFAIFNIDSTHESMIWRKSATPKLCCDSSQQVVVPPYLPNTPVAIDDIERMYSNVIAMDRRVGEILHELEEVDLLDSTIIFWYTDHGGPLPRQKRTIYDSGIRVPMIVRFPEKQLANTVDSQLLSFVDFLPTLLSVSGIEPPSGIDGRAWMGEYRSNRSREVVYAAADRFDNETDRIRAVRDDRFKYVRNYFPDTPYYLAVKYRETMPIMQEMLRLYDEGRVDNLQALWFRKKKDPEELFDTKNDPYELNNLIGKSKYKSLVQSLRDSLDHWILQTGDLGLMEENKYISTIWPEGKQPITMTPVITEREGERISITCATPGATIGYKWLNSKNNIEEASVSMGWSIYEEPILEKEGILLVRAHRIGYRPSMRVVKSY